MRFIFKKYFIVFTSTYILTLIVPGISISNGWSGLFYACLVLSLLFYIGKPIVNLLMLPINLLTLNLSAWLMNIVIFYIWSILVTEVKIQEWHYEGGTYGSISVSPYLFADWQVVIFGAILLTALIQFLRWLTK